MTRHIIVWVMLCLLTGCLRLSDPIFAHKPLEAEEPPGPEYSLLFVTVLSSPSVRSSEALSGPPEFHSLLFARVDPHGKKEGGVDVRSAPLYRVLRPRVMKDGHFMILVPPGVYELDGMMETRFLLDVVWRVRDDARAPSRIQITRPGIYDLGTLTVVSGSMATPASIVAAGDAFSEWRLEILSRAVRGTSWEELLERVALRR